LNHRLDGLTDGERRVVIGRALGLFRRVRNRRGWDLEDLFQAGAMGVLAARLARDPDEPGWIDYAAAAAYNQMIRVVFPSVTRIDGKQTRVDVTRDAAELGPDDAPCPGTIEDAAAEGAAARVDEILGLVTSSQREAFALSYGLGGERFVLNKRDARSRREYSAIRHKIRRGIARIRRALDREAS
jgi:DNA-directed RNA polymerase specialized sigma24 family protein